MVPHRKCHKAIIMFFPTCSPFQWRILGYLLVWTHAQMPLFGWSQLRVSETDIPTVDHQKMGRVDMIMSWWPKLVHLGTNPVFRQTHLIPYQNIHIDYLYIYVYINHIYNIISIYQTFTGYTYIYISVYIYIIIYIIHDIHIPPSSNYIISFPPRLGHFLP